MRGKACQCCAAPCTATKRHVSLSNSHGTSISVTPSKISISQYFAHKPPLRGLSRSGNARGNTRELLLDVQHIQHCKIKAHNDDYNFQAMTVHHVKAQGGSGGRLVAQQCRRTPGLKFSVVLTYYYYFMLLLMTGNDTSVYILHVYKATNCDNATTAPSFSSAEQQQLGVAWPIML